MESIVVSSSTPSSNPRDFWAKSSGESIATHTLRVLENLYQLHERTPTLDQISGSPLFWARAALAVCLHDLGKCCAGFQAVVHEQKKFPHRHEALSAIFARWILADLPDDAKWVAAAILSHHKDWPQIDDLYPPAEYDCADGLEALLPQMPAHFFNVAQQIVRDEVWPYAIKRWPILELWTTRVNSPLWIPPEPAKELRLAFEAARSVIQSAGQLGISREAIEGTLLRGAVVLSDHSGSAWEDLTILKGLETTESLQSRIGIKKDSNLYPHQLQAAACTGNCVLIAPTGSGKTEAALLWAAQQNSQQTGEPILYYLLPYQASLNAMRQRLTKIFGDEPVALQHSRAVQALYRQLLEKDYSAKEAQRVANRERNLTSLFVKSLRISTPYQLLKGAFQLRGHETLWTAATNALFIMDEVHVYETQRLAIMLATMRHLCTYFGGRIMLMSATLPTYLLSSVATLLPGISTINAAVATLREFRRHEIRLIDSDLTDANTIESICSDAKGGMGVLVVATTVGRAQEIWRTLQGKLACPVELLHGRFHADDRSNKEAQLLKSRGVGAAGPRKAVVLVATQVVEVSLNIDFDVLYTDPAPLEALLQRFGRINRERRHSLRTVNICTKIPEGSPVYPEFLVRRALMALGKSNGNPLDEEDVSKMLDQIYEGEFGARLTQELKDRIKRFSTDVLANCRPFSSDEAIESLFEELFDGYEVLPKSLMAEYDRRVEEEPLLAPGLLIPITRGQYFSLKSRKRLDRKDRILVADCPYSEIGLEVSGPPSQDGI